MLDWYKKRKASEIERRRMMNEMYLPWSDIQKRKQPRTYNPWYPAVPQKNVTQSPWQIQPIQTIQPFENFRESLNNADIRVEDRRTGDLVTVGNIVRVEKVNNFLILTMDTGFIIRINEDKLKEEKVLHALTSDKV